MPKSPRVATNNEKHTNAFTENPTKHNVCERRGRTAASQPQSYIYEYIEGFQSLDVEATGGHLRVTDGETERNLTSHSFVCYYQDTR